MMKMMKKWMMLLLALMMLCGCAFAEDNGAEPTFAFTPEVFQDTWNVLLGKQIGTFEFINTASEGVEVSLAFLENDIQLSLVDLQGNGPTDIIVSASFSMATDNDTFIAGLQQAGRYLSASAVTAYYNEIGMDGLQETIDQLGTELEWMNNLIVSDIMAAGSVTVSGTVMGYPCSLTMSYLEGEYSIAVSMVILPR